MARPTTPMNRRSVPRRLGLPMKRQTMAGRAPRGTGARRACQEGPAPQGRPPAFPGGRRWWVHRRGPAAPPAIAGPARRPLAALGRPALSWLKPPAGTIGRGPLHHNRHTALFGRCPFDPRGAPLRFHIAGPSIPIAKAREPQTGARQSIPGRPAPARRAGAAFGPPLYGGAEGEMEGLSLGGTGVRPATTRHSRMRRARPTLSCGARALAQRISRAPWRFPRSKFSCSGPVSGCGKGSVRRFSGGSDFHALRPRRDKRSFCVARGFRRPLGPPRPHPRPVIPGRAFPNSGSPGHLLGGPRPGAGVEGSEGPLRRPGPVSKGRAAPRHRHGVHPMCWRGRAGKDQVSSPICPSASLDARPARPTSKLRQLRFTWCAGIWPGNPLRGCGARWELVFREIRQAKTATAPAAPFANVSGHNRSCVDRTVGAGPAFSGADHPRRQRGGCGDVRFGPKPWLTGLFRPNRWWAKGGSKRQIMRPHWND